MYARQGATARAAKAADVADLPAGLTRARNVDASARAELVSRRVLIGLIVVGAGLALANVFGQEEVASRVVASGASLEVAAPVRVRGGLFFQGRFTIGAERELEHATLVLDRGWLEGMHINTIEPSPVGESSRDGKLALDFGRLPAGDFLVAYLQFQVNPTNVGRRSQDVEVYDDEELLARVDRTVTVLP
jgi:hypothetical protein